MPFTVIDLAASGWERGEREPDGDESKRWFVPPETLYESWPAFDVFAGYLTLDAWIVNT